MRFLFMALLLLPLTACYHPLYGNKPRTMESASAQEEKLNAIFITSIPDENGQYLRNLLIDRFYGQGRPIHPAYRLDITIAAKEEKLGLQKDATSTRARLNITATYTLFEKESGKSLFSATSRSTTNYNILDQQLGTLTSRENASQRGLKEIADLMTTRLLLYFGQ